MPNDQSDQIFPWLEIDNKGRFHLLYLDTRNKAQSDSSDEGWYDAYYAYSVDGTKPWKEFRLTKQPWGSHNDGISGRSFIGDYLGMGVSNNSAWPVYFDTSAGDPDIFTHSIQFK